MLQNWQQFARYASEGQIRGGRACTDNLAWIVLRDQLSVGMSHHREDLQLASIARS